MNVDNLSLELDGRTILSDISFSVDEGSVLGILCPNNSCKTTLIKTLSGIIYSTSGKIIVNDTLLSKNNYNSYIIKISTILDDIDNQFLCNKVSEELGYPLQNLGYDDLEIKDTISDISSLLDIKTILGKDISRLSMFEKIKVLIGASVIHNPKVLLVDDILRFLNKNDKEEIIKIFKSLAYKLNISVIYTTSDLNDLIDSNRVIVIDEGRIVMDDSFDTIILNDNELTKMGFDIPIMIDLSRKLQFYKLVDKIYYDPDKLVNALWK